MRINSHVQVSCALVEVTFDLHIARFHIQIRPSPLVFGPAELANSLEQLALLISARFPI